MSRRKGFTLIEVIVVVAITGFMLLITVVGYNNVTNAGMKTQLWRAERIVELAIAHVVQSGRSISTGYYSIQSFYTNYGMMLPMNPLIFANEKTGISTANQWYIVNNSGVYTVYPVGKNGSYSTAFGVVANNDVPFFGNQSITYSEPTTTEFVSTANGTNFYPFRDRNFIYNGDFEKGDTAWSTTYSGSSPPVVILQTEAYTGKTSFGFYLRGAGTRTISQSVSTSGLPGDRYVLSYAIKSLAASVPSNYTAQISVSYKPIGSTSYTTIFSNSLSSTSAWVVTNNYQTSPITVTYDTVKIDITVTGTSASASSGVFLIDNISLYLLYYGE